MHYKVKRQVFSWRAKKMQICCIITWKSRFSHDAPKRWKFVAFLSGKPGFLVTRQKGANLLHYYVERQVSSWRAKKVQICCIFKWKSTVSRDAPKRCKFVAFYVEKQVFSWRSKKVQICCIFRWKRRLSRDAPKWCKFVAFLIGKAGCLVTRQKGANLLHYFVEKQVFSWRDRKQC